MPIVVARRPNPRPEDLPGAESAPFRPMRKPGLAALVRCQLHHDVTARRRGDSVAGYPAF